MKRHNYRIFAIVMLSCVLIFLSVSITVAQEAVTEGTTPLGLSPGSPAGSYALSGFDNVNLFNGSLNFTLPLVKVGGRGGVGYSLVMRIDQKWLVEKEQYGEPPSNFYYPSSSWWTESGWVPIYSMGKMETRQGGSRDFVNGCGGYIHRQTLTRLTFTAPDGTEYELRDQLTNGEPDTPTCATGFNRGTVFITTDGTSATFISDTAIVDYIYDNPGNLPPSGYMMLRDGTRYRIYNGNVTWMRDRNGNRLTFTYDSSQRMTGVTDSLNRTVTIAYANPGNYDEITMKGFGGAARSLKVHFTTLSGALRSDFTLQTPQQLFPDLNGAGTYSSNNSLVVSAVDLPNGKQYQFRYNSYSELARVDLPTGGAFEYDWAAGLTDSVSGSGVFTPYTAARVIYRRMIERRVYPDGGSGTGFASRMTYSRPESSTTNAGYIVTDQYDSSGALKTREHHYFYGSARQSFSIQPTQYAGWQDGREYKTETFDTNGASILRRSENTWQQPLTGLNWPLTQAETSATAKPNNAQLTQILTTLLDTNQVAKQTFDYDFYNNQNNVKEYDIGSGAAGGLVRETRTTFVTSSTYTGTDVYLRNLPSQVSIYDASNTLRAQTVLEYDNYGTADAFHAAIVPYPQAGVSGSPSGFDSSFNSTTANLARGNVTKTTRNILNTSGAVTGSISSYAQYDVLGNVVKAIDPRSTSTNIIAATISYADRFGSPNGDARTNSGSIELNTPSQVSYALPSLVTNALGHTAYTKYDYYLGKPVDGEDANGVVATGYYDDLLDRPTEVKRAFGTTLQNHSTFNYDDVGRVITTTSDLDSNADGLLIGKLFYDQMGRTIETRQYEGSGHYIAVQTQYDVLGRAYKTSNPFRPWQSEIALWTTSAFDALGRMTSVTTPDSAAVNTSYSGNEVSVTDQLSKGRKSVTDGLGRLTSVYEDPSGLNYQTSYAYDALDNLTTVTQGAQTRTFVYDSLKRLTSAVNPESGTISYTYDSNGNLATKTDARSTTATYAYDSLNRNTTIDYSDTSSINPDITRLYDGATKGKGRLWDSYAGGTYTAGTTVEHTKVIGYDALGRPLSQLQEFRTNSVWGSAYTEQRTYNLAGGVTSQTYPSGHSVTYNYDAAGRLGDKDTQNLAFTGNLGDGVSRTYSRGISYASLGGLSQEQFGTDTAIYNKLFYNSRGQLAEIREGLTPNDDNWERGAIINFYGTCWGKCGGHNSTTAMTVNNGNLRRQEIYIPGGPTFAQTFEYDSLNRLQSMSEDSSLRQEYIYDRYGNRTINGNVLKTFGNGINNIQTVASTATNRMYGPNETDASHTLIDYDLAGNQTKDLLTTNGAATGIRTYDAENRMAISRDANGNQIAAYTYNADGQRVRRTIAGLPSAVETWQVYGMAGELLAEYAANAPYSTPQKEYGYRNGQLLITAEPSPSTRANVAVSSAGATATAQNYTLDSTYPGSHFQPAYANDGVRFTTTIGDHYWRDEHGLPSWLQIDFNGSKTIDEVDVYTMADNYATQADPSATQTFSSYGTTAYDVQYWTGSAWQTVTGGSISGNNLVWKKINFTAVTTSKIRVVANAAVDSVARIAEVEAWGVPAASTRANAAVSSSGATATAQNYTSDSAYPGSHFQPAYANDGVRFTTTIGDHYWRDEHGLPSWLQIDFNGTKTIDEIDVYTMADNYATQADPSATQTFSNYGTTAYDVQYWTGSAWATVSGGSITGNNLVWKKLNFTAITTSKIRVMANSAVDSVARIVEVEAWTVASTGTSANINWLVTDQLGTPRMVFDKTGSLAATKRHDYLPFGEELFATQGARTMGMGYSVADGVRQKFTQKERDNETGLDYFLARYYSSTQGRFTSADDFLNDTRVADPASWNLYAYVRNNPLRYVDPLGQTIEETQDKKHKLTKDEKKAIEKDLRAKTGLSSIQFDKNGKLTYDKNEKAQGGSAQLRQGITGAIDDTKNVFQVGDYSGSENIQFALTDAGSVLANTGVTTYQVKIDFADFRDARNLSDSDALNAFSLGLTLDHEIDHKVSYDPSNPVPVGGRRDEGPGGVIANVNVAEGQLGLPTRAPGSHTGRPYSGPDSRYKDTYQIQFNNASGKAKFVRWKLENQRQR